MININIAGYPDPKRNIWLSLPATEEQQQQAFEKLTESLPIGVTFPYQLKGAESDFHLPEKHIQYNSDIGEVNLLSYMLENIEKDLRDLYVKIADAKEPQSLSAFINELSAVKSGWYEVSDDIDVMDGNGALIDAKYIRNFNTSPDIYRLHFKNDWLETERREYEQRQAAAPIDPEHPFAGANVRERSIIPYFEEVTRIAVTQGLTTKLNDRTDEILSIYLGGNRVCSIDGYSGAAGYNPYDEVLAILDDIHETRLRIPFADDPEREAQRLAAIKDLQPVPHSQSPAATLRREPLSHQHHNNKMLDFVDMIGRLTDGMCTVGPGPFGFGVANNHSSKIGIIIQTKPDMSQDSTIFPSEVESYEISAAGFSVSEGKMLIEAEIETAASNPEDPSTRKIALALKELSKHAVQISAEDCQTAYCILADEECAKAYNHDQNDDPDESPQMGGMTL